MVTVKACINSAVAAIMLGIGSAACAAPPAALYDALATASAEDAPRIAQRIRAEWGRSGSAAMDLLLARGEAAMEAGEAGAAIGHLSALVDHAPDFVQARVARARAYAMAGQTGPALDDLRVALMHDPRHFEALEGLALILQDAGRVEAARAAWDEVTRIHPHSPVAAQARAALAIDTGETDA